MSSMNSCLHSGPGCPCESQCTNRFCCTRPRSMAVRWPRSTFASSNTNRRCWWSKPATTRWVLGWRFVHDFMILFVFLTTGIRCILLITLVRTQPQGWQGQPTGVLWHRRNVPVLVVSGTGPIPVGGHRGWQRPGPRFGAVYGGRLENDNDRWRVSFSFLIFLFSCGDWYLTLKCIFQWGPSHMDGRKHSLRQNGQLHDIQQSATLSIRRLRDPSARGVRICRRLGTVTT